MDEFKKHFVIKKQDVKEHIYLIPLYECLGKRKQEADQWFPGTAGKE